LYDPLLTDVEGMVAEKLNLALLHENEVSGRGRERVCVHVCVIASARGREEGE